MNPGQFRQRIDINLKVDAQNSDYGNIAITNSTTFSRFAKVKWLSSSEVIEAETLTVRRNLELTFRFDDLMVYLDRITSIPVDNGTYKIDSMQQTGLGNQQYIVIRASTFLH